MPILVTGSRQCGIGCACRLPGTLLNKIERVQAGPQFRTHDQICKCLVLSRVRFSPVGGLCGRHQFKRPIWPWGGAEDLAVNEAATLGHRGIPGRTAVDLGSRHSQGAGDDLTRPVQRAGEEVGAVEDRVRQAQLVRLRASQHPVLVQWILDDQLNGPLGTDQVGHDEGSAPTRKQAQRRFGQGDPRGGRRNRPVMAVQGELKPAAQCESVDESESRYRETPAACRKRHAQSGRWPVPGRD